MLHEYLWMLRVKPGSLSDSTMAVSLLSLARVVPKATEKNESVKKDVSPYIGQECNSVVMC